MELCSYGYKYKVNNVTMIKRKPTKQCKHAIKKFTLQLRNSSFNVTDIMGKESSTIVLETAEAYYVHMHICVCVSLYLKSAC